MVNWKEKLAAFLHDPPSKCLDIRTHGERSDAAFRQAGFTDQEIGEYFKHADHTGAAADRRSFPDSEAAVGICRSVTRLAPTGTERPQTSARLSEVEPAEKILAMRITMSNLVTTRWSRSNATRTLRW